MQRLQRVAFPLEAVGAVDLEPGEAEQTDHFSGLVEVTLDQAGGKLSGRAAHVDDGRRLERVAGEGGRPGRRSAAGHGEPVAGASETVLAGDKLLARGVDLA